MPKIPFDIMYRQEIENGTYKVVTRDGRDVRIVCWDALGDAPVVALVKNVAENKTFYEIPVRTGLDGKVGMEALDLFILTEDINLTDFEKTYLKVVHHLSEDDILPHFLTDNKVRENAQELLDAAHKQLRHDIDAEIAKACEAQYQRGRKDVKKDSLEWVKIPPYDGQAPMKEWVIIDGKLANSRLGYEIEIDKLFDLLPKRG